WIEELNKDEHTPESEEYGITSFVYRSRKPFDPERFWDFSKNRFPNNIIRSKGLFWLASRPAQALVWGQAGGSMRVESAGVWWSSMPYAKRIQHASYLQNKKLIDSGWDYLFGDRKNEIVIIGQEMDEAEITAELDACLATRKELRSQKWKKGYDDAWPVQKAFPMD
ncbi:MAG: GTP-binding protein, partial [Bacteroidota bacterium]